eukprot:CAMPEP_0174715862 /NCGR_PEP_ID=MMETSP1094-20130205/22652_1 /TAXON_ID=156173 /ORGANISM="Chrysochromulina brevifilum, Strain UTEX LB 985" /LENGTH=591 /DNA_ID=CAMNT_0015915525 /DNA_START=24 /DNA_END=1799 /DNA_ORIENTATION=+
MQVANLSVVLLIAVTSLSNAQEMLDGSRDHLMWTTACATRPFETRVITNPQDASRLSQYDSSAPALEGVKIRQGKYCSWGPTYEALSDPALMGETPILDFDAPWTMVIETSFPQVDGHWVYLQFDDRHADGTPDNPSCNSYGQGTGRAHLYFANGHEGSSRGLMGFLNDNGYVGNRADPVRFENGWNGWKALYHYDSSNLAYNQAIKAIESSMLKICPTCTRPSKFQFVITRTADLKFNVKMYVEEGTPEDEAEDTFGTYVLKLEVESTKQYRYNVCSEGTTHCGGVPISMYLNGMRQDTYSWRAAEGLVPPAGANGDPHLSLPHGGRADFRGEHQALYSFLSARNLAVNVMTELADFELYPVNHPRHKNVHGSFITQAHIVARTNQGKMVRNSFWASMIGDTNIAWTNGTIDNGPRWKLGPKMSKVIDDVAFRTDYSSLYVTTPEFEIVVTPNKFQKLSWTRNVVGLTHQLDVQIKARIAEEEFKVAPHGIIGQGWDGDGKAIDGELDEYPETGEFTTYAMARGAIEGMPNDYRLASKYATDFKFSRFDADEAKPRDVKALVASGELNPPRAGTANDRFVGSTEYNFTSA